MSEKEFTVGTKITEVDTEKGRLIPANEQLFESLTRNQILGYERNSGLGLNSRFWLRKQDRYRSLSYQLVIVTDFTQGTTRSPTRFEVDNGERKQEVECGLFGSEGNFCVVVDEARLRAYCDNHPEILEELE